MNLHPPLFDDERQKNVLLIHAFQTRHHGENYQIIKTWEKTIDVKKAARHIARVEISSSVKAGSAFLLLSSTK
jgi:hypothetical protein